MENVTSLGFLLLLREGQEEAGEVPVSVVRRKFSRVDIERDTEIHVASKTTLAIERTVNDTHIKEYILI